MAMRRTFLLHLLLLCPLLVGGPLWAQPAAQPALHMPSFAQCQNLANPKTAAADKASLTQLFKANNLYCSMSTAPIAVQHVFSALENRNAQSKSQLRLIMGLHDKYVIDGKSLLDVLLPDRAAIPPLQLFLLAGQVIGMLGDVFSSNLDPSTMTHVTGKANALVGVLGINARAALQQLAFLRAQTKLNDDDIEPSFWLTRLSRIEGPTPAQTQTTQPAPSAFGGPVWMQKLLGAGKHIMGTLTSQQ